MSELKAASEASSYERQFRCAMHMVREREAEMEELKGLFGDLEEAVSRQVLQDSDKLCCLKLCSHMIGYFPFPFA